MTYYFFFILYLQKLVATLNSGAIASANEVVIAPSQVHLGAFQGKLRKDIGIASQVRKQQIA